MYSAFSFVIALLSGVAKHSKLWNVLNGNVLS